MRAERSDDIGIAKSRLAGDGEESVVVASSFSASALGVLSQHCYVLSFCVHSFTY